MQQAALFRRERQFGEVKAVLWFCGSSAIISVICERHWGFCVHWLSTLVCEKLITSQICHMFNGRSHGNKILKLRKFRANEYRVKFTWTMLSAAEILYQKKRPIIAHIILLIFRKPHLKMPGKNYKKFAWVDWKNYYLHRRKLQKSFLYSWLKQLSCNFFRTPLGVFSCDFFKFIVW